MARRSIDNDEIESYQDDDCLSNLPVGKLIRRDDLEYNRKKRHFQWNGILCHEPNCFAEIADVRDIESVIHDVAGKIPLGVLSGGHGGVIPEDGVVIDFSEFNAIHVLTDEKVAIIEPGAKLGDVDVATVKHGLTVPLGTASIIGFGGQALDLGMGFLNRSYGFLTDNVIEYDLITANGTKMKVNKDTEPELFWAMRGYGANFGVTYKYKVKLHSIPGSVVGGCCYFPWNDAAAVVKHARDFQHTLDDRKLSLNTMLHIGKSSFQVFYRMLYNGDAEQGKYVATNLVSTCPSLPLFNNIEPLSYDVFQRACDHLYEHGLFYYLHPGHFLETLSDEYVDVMTNLIAQLTSEDNQYTTVYFQILGGAIEDFPEESSPFVLRKAKWWVGITGCAKGKDNYERTCKLIDSTMNSLDSYSIKIDQEKFENIQRRLSKTKEKYDPKNIFRYNNNNIVPETCTQATKTHVEE